MVYIKRKYIIAICVSAIVLSLVLTRFVYANYTEYIYAERVRHYLLEEMKYDMKEIKEIKGIYGGKLPSCIVTVTFRDEPYLEYIYYAHNGIFQASFRMIDQDFEKQITRKKLKHYDREFDSF